ncbi:MAG: Strongly-conserved Zn-finger binding protein (TFIIIA) [Caeruleum heppii]|nr:MAG: Strongly-conserved Zn-finger binding protein (TFIIIA) [Caeruleum heppii]
MTVNAASRALGSLAIGKRKERECLDEDQNGTKRQCVTVTAPEAKDPRVGADDSNDSSSCSSGDDEDSYKEDAAESTSQPTPTTPLSSSSPRRKFPSEEKTHHCHFPLCLRSFNRPARLAEHIRSHTDERPFACAYSECSKSFRREAHLSHHVKSAHTGQRDHACDWQGCAKKFLTATRLRRHRDVHEGENKHRCRGYSPCRETFRKHGTLQMHVSSVHLGQKPFPCHRLDPITGQPCDKAYDTAGRLGKHEGRAHAVEARFICTDCSLGTQVMSEDRYQEPTSIEFLRFPTYALLQAHMKDIHPPTCAQCSQPFSTQKQLRQHVELHHQDPLSQRERATHLCTYPSCGKSFTKKGNLNVHIRTVHETSTAISYTCGETDLTSSKDLKDWTSHEGCGKVFKAKGSLAEHVRKDHLGLAPPNRRQNRKNNKKALSSLDTATAPTPSTIAALTGTAYVDNHARPIACPLPYCAFRFTREYDLEKHMKTKHGMADAEIERSLHAIAVELAGDDVPGQGEDDDEEEEAFDRFVASEERRERELERRAIAGGAFWIGSTEVDDDQVVDDNEDIMEREEMMALSDLVQDPHGHHGLAEEMDTEMAEVPTPAPHHLVSSSATSRDVESEERLIDPVLRYLRRGE